MASKEKFGKLPTTHQFAFFYSWWGFKGSSYLWRIAKYLQKTPSGQVLLPNGIAVSNSENDWTAKTIYEGTYERELLKFLMKLKIQDEIYVDIGANIGSTIQSVKKKNKEIKVYAFEPSAICLPLLRQNLRESKYVSIQECAVSEGSGEIEFFDDENPYHTGLANSRSMNRNATAAKVVTCVSLDEFFETSKLDLIVKIDTEGHEPKVLSGMKKLIDKGAVKMVIMEYTPQWMSFEFIHDLNLKIWGHVESRLYVIQGRGLFRTKLKVSQISSEALFRIDTQVNIILSKELPRYMRSKRLGRNVEL